MKKLLFCLALYSFVSLYSMAPRGKQLLLCPKRKEAVQTQIPSGICPFCDEENLAKNYVVKEDEENDCRIMMNKFPYFDFSQGYHLLIMPIAHKTSFMEFSQKGFAAQLNEALRINAQFYPGSYSESYFIHLGEGGGQSVPHLHSHVQTFIQKPLSLPETIENKNAASNNMEHAFETVKLKLAENILPEARESSCNYEDCYSCSIINHPENDEKNFVIGRFKHNLVCLAHFPEIAAHIVVIPYHHGHALKELRLEEWLENITLALSILPKLKVYVQTKVRQWTGDNTFTKSLGDKASDEEKNKYHLYTSIMPRTTIHSSSGTIDGQVCKLDYDAVDLFQYLKKEAVF